MTYQAVANRAAAEHLEIFGGLHPDPEDNVPGDVNTLLLLGPREPGFWAHVTASPEFLDGQPDPVDRWSERVIGKLAREIGAQAFFPFGGPPYRPFIAWAHRTGRAWASEVGILVHDTAGLMVSYRGAIGLRERLPMPRTGDRPCDTCSTKPCLTACPVGALTQDGYDVPSCKSFLKSKAGKDCMEGGCAVRRACPVSQRYGRLPEQSAYHMERFLG